MSVRDQSRRARALGTSVATKLRAEGTAGLARRAVRRAYQRLDAGELDFGLLPGDIADSATLDLLAAVPVPTPRSLRVGWLCTPPAVGSGGHTTMFRMVQALQAAGHVCEVVLHDRHNGSLSEAAANIGRGWPHLSVGVRDLSQGFEGLDVVVATGWESAHVLASRGRDPVHRAYFIQDYEPMFYPHGSDHALAADTYHFGFANIALGRMVHDRLTAAGAPSVEVLFGRDTSTYSFENAGPRSGVAFYARPPVARRGYRLATLALAEFHRRRPDQEIHVYGATVHDVDFPVVQHGRPTPAELNELYNQCAAGLAMSFTNISLVAYEMLAAGCIPVVNDSPDARADFRTPHAVWAAATPASIASALEAAVGQTTPATARRAASDTAGDTWGITGAQVVAAIEALAAGRMDVAAVKPLNLPDVEPPDVADHGTQGDLLCT
ncbi:glycosyltransferase family 1 protein [Nocardioides hwasunensis]|uniref:Glycosyltransferase family 1 protein n=1 Tax=Nocardioides hwasunensis TaxID=397258 RepID=A0ABR8MKD8_9ACTN|nr:glycosyltransferase family 1 protein [Nocardioides hwasunensis]MBD3915232.1 glycosyltransferase family 1 protein [Nocardioides hwasunensis]